MKAAVNVGGKSLLESEGNKRPQSESGNQTKAATDPRRQPPKLNQKEAPFELGLAGFAGISGADLIQQNGYSKTARRVNLKYSA